MFLQAIKGIINAAAGGGGSSGAVISVEAVTFQQTGTSTTVNLTKGQTYTQCVPFYSLCRNDTQGGSTAATRNMHRIQIIDNSGTPAIVSTTTSTSSNNHVVVYVVEFNNKVSVQQIDYTGYPSATASCTAVDLSKAFLINTVKLSSDDNDWDGSSVRSRFTSTTGLSFSRVGGLNGSLQGTAYVVEDVDGNVFDVQPVEDTFSSIANHDNTITSAPLNSSMVIFTHDANYGGSKNGRACLGFLADATTLRFTTNTTVAINASAFVVTWLDGTVVQHIDFSNSSTTSQTTVTANETISSVNVDRSIVFSTMMNGKGECGANENSTQTWADMETQHRAEITSATNVEMRYFSGAVALTNESKFEVVDFAAAGGGGTELLTDLVAWFPMIETVNSTRYDVNGSVTLNGSTQSVGSEQGKINRCAEFLNDWLIGGSSTGMNAKATGFSFALWHKMQYKTADRAVVCNATGYLASQRSYLLNYDNSADRFVFEMSDGSTQYALSADTLGSPSVETWYHIYCEYDGSTDTLGISINNGTLDTLAGPSTVNSVDSFWIGQIPTYDRLYGEVCDFAFWDRILTEAERSALYNSGNGITYYNISGATLGLKDYLLCYWDMGQSGGATARTDSHGSADLTASLTAPDTGTGIIGNATDFDGNNDYLLTTSKVSPFGSFSLQCWINPDSVTGTQLVAYFYTANNPALRLNGTAVNFSVYDGATQTASAGTLSTGNWYHIVAVYDASAGEIVVYVNGSAGTPVSVSTITQSLNGGIQFGCTSSYFEDYDGLIDECALWDRALTSSEVSTLYNSGSGLAYSSW